MILFFQITNKFQNKRTFFQFFKNWSGLWKKIWPLFVPSPLPSPWYFCQNVNWFISLLIHEISYIINMIMSLIWWFLLFSTWKKHPFNFLTINLDNNHTRNDLSSLFQRILFTLILLTSTMIYILLFLFATLMDTAASTTRFHTLWIQKNRDENSAPPLYISKSPHNNNIVYLITEYTNVTSMYNVVLSSSFTHILNSVYKFSIIRNLAPIRST